MKKLLNTLYVTQPNSYLYKDGNSVVVSVDQKDVFRIPIINIEAIVSFGYAGCSPGLMKLCSDSGVSLSFFTPNGQFIARIQGKIKGNIVLRHRQHLLSDKDDITLSTACIIIAAKIHNYRAILMRYERDYGKDETIQKAVAMLAKLQRKALDSPDKDTLRGIEGLASATYFDTFPRLITQQKDYFIFEGRNRRPPKDAVNALLSFSYTILANEITSALESVGLDPYIGVFHTLRPGRASLSLDIMEEFRAYLCDRFVLSLINRKQIQPGDFLSQGTNGVIMTDNGRKKMLSAWQTRKQEDIVHPYLKEKVKIGLLPYIQAVMMARMIRGEAGTYPPFLIK